MADYPEDPVGDVGGGFTPINRIKEESTIVEPNMADINLEVKQEGHEDAEDEVMSPTFSTVTPKKRGKKNQTAAPSTPASDTPSKKAKVTPAKLIPLPNTYEEAGPEDRMILRMRDVEGRSWGEIAAAWEEMTGSKPGRSSLGTRYSRMKANFVVFNPEHMPILLNAKKEIESQLESMKWQKIADLVEEKCGSKYPHTTLQKKFKEVTKKTNISASIIKDED
ncbi:hypothetical protein PHISCL_00461 [Aspergillus sclerotialis]|uniref:Uncharacterized protein n=1 Tax=Aspergillus sclerotialis TaxID=2070753 RepID=A0A3A2ZX12_9EURO|nr:hypothetical protein PHISCL_00461 [Aspergillus sclerotialis]